MFRHEIVHNKYVVDRLKKKGLFLLRNLRKLKIKQTCNFSAHGVPKKVPIDAKNYNMEYIDATCPLVLKYIEKLKIYIKLVIICINWTSKSS